MIELLVVIAIIAILVSILMPSLNKAKILAIRAACLSNMRSTLMSLHTYAGDHAEFPPNVGVNAAGEWVGWALPGSTEWLALGPHYGNIPMVSSVYFGLDGAPSHWRGHLLNGKYGAARTLGCSRGLPDGYSHHSWHEASNWFETDAGQRAALREAPAYIYMGPGVDRYLAASTWHIGIAQGPGMAQARAWRSYNFGRPTPLLGDCYSRDNSTYIEGNFEDYFNLHSRQRAWTRNPSAGRPWPEPVSYGQAIDKTIGWSDGHAVSVVNPKAPGWYTPFPITDW